MNKKKLLGLVALLPLIGGLNGTGKAFATKTVANIRGEIKQENDELINEVVKYIDQMFTFDFMKPQIKVNDNGMIIVSKSKDRRFGEKSKKIGKNFELNENEFRKWWKKDIAEIINNCCCQAEKGLITKGLIKVNFGGAGKCVNTIETLKEKGLLEKAISQYIETKWDEQLQKFQKQIEEKRDKVQKYTNRIIRKGR